MSMTKKELDAFLRKLPKNIMGFAKVLKDKKASECHYIPTPIQFTFCKKAYLQGYHDGHISGYKAAAIYIIKMIHTWVDGRDE